MFLCLSTLVSTPSVILVSVAVICRVLYKFCKSVRVRQTFPENDRRSRVAVVQLTARHKLVLEPWFRRPTKRGDVEFVSRVLETRRRRVNKRDEEGP